MESALHASGKSSLNILLEPSLSPAVREVLIGAAVALELSDIPTAIKLPDRRFIYVNQAFESLYGFSSAESLGRIEIPIHAKAFPCQLIEAIYKGTEAGGWEGRVENQNRDRQNFKIILRTRPLRTENGELAGYLGILHPCEWQRMPILLNEETPKAALQAESPPLLKYPAEGLSLREREVLNLYGRGHHTKEIAAILNISIPSVFTYRARLVRKLGIKNPADFYLVAAQSATLQGAQP